MKTWSVFDKYDACSNSVGVAAERVSRGKHSAFHVRSNSQPVHIYTAAAAARGAAVGVLRAMSRVTH